MEDFLLETFYNEYLYFRLLSSCTNMIFSFLGMSASSLVFVLGIRRARVETLNGAELCLEPAKGISMALRCTVIPVMCAGGHWGIMGRGGIIIKNKSIIY